MNLFHICVSRLLKETATEHLRCTTKKAEQYKFAQHCMRTFTSLRTRLLREVNMFIDLVTNKCDATQLGLYIQNTEGSTGLNGAFNDDGLVNMLEAAVIKDFTCHHL